MIDPRLRNWYRSLTPEFREDIFYYYSIDIKWFADRLWAEHLGNFQYPIDIRIKYQALTDTFSVKMSFKDKEWAEFAVWDNQSIRKLTSQECNEFDYEIF